MTQMTQIHNMRDICVNLRDNQSNASTGKSFTSSRISHLATSSIKNALSGQGWTGGNPSFLIPHSILLLPYNPKAVEC